MENQTHAQNQRVPVIQVSGLKKQYKLGQIGGGTLTHDLQSWWARVRGKEDPNTVIGTDARLFGKTFMALNGVDLTVYKGEALGIIGRNGAGKSTLLNLISNRVYPDAGTVTIDGQDCRDNDQALGKLFLTSEKNLYPESMRVGDAIRWTASFYSDFDQPYALSLAEAYELPLKKKIKSLSTGYGSIFKLVVALAANTPYLLLDEPVLGLDAHHRQLFYRQLLESYNKNPRCIVISTHLIEEVARVIERVVILNEGRLVCHEACDELLQRCCCITGPAEAVDRFAAGRKVLGCDALGGLKACYLLEPAPAELPAGLQASAPDLQQLFINLTNGGTAK